MGKDKDKDEKPDDGLTDEQRALAKKIEEVVYENVIERMKKILAVAGVVTGLFGVATFATIKSALIDATANKLAGDSTVRDEVVASTTKKLQSVNKIIDEVDELQKKAKERQELDLVSANEELQTIRKLAEHLTQDMKSRLRP